MKKLKIFLGVVCGTFLGVLCSMNCVMAEEINEKIPEIYIKAINPGYTVDGNEKIPEIYIKAINPGYTVDGKSNVGEMIEIGRKESDTPISLAGITISYTNSSGNSSILFEFPEHSLLTGETLLLRLASSPESELAAVNYTKTLAYKGGIDLMVDNEKVDSVCWTGKDECYKDFKSANPTVLVRNLETGDFEHIGVTEYEPVYDSESYVVEASKDEEGYGQVASQCRGLQFSEILSYYESSHTEAEGYYVYYLSGFNLTKNPTNFNTLEIIDTDGTVVDLLKYPNGQRKGASYIFVGYDEVGEEIWKVTYAPTPGAANNYQEFRTCEAGKVINEVTGNCVKVTSIAEKFCKEGYFLNILTGRCNKMKTVEEKTCKEGYELNPETNRCRKIKENTGANYSLEPETYEEKSSFVALYAVLGVVGVGILFLIWEFRQEIVKLWRKVFRRAR